jgi:hypothetical protein
LLPRSLEKPTALVSPAAGISLFACPRRAIHADATLVAWAKQLGRDDAIELLESNLEQEKKADRLLTEIAESAVNQKAAA